MTKFYSLFAAVIFAASVNAQDVFYSENMGTPTGTVSIAGNTWQVGSPVNYTGTADVRDNSISSGYAGASGGGNILFNKKDENFVISGIDTSDYINITLSFGHLKSNNASTNELTVEVSEDGAIWTPLTYTRATGSNGWLLINPTGTIPSVENLRLRFNQSTGGSAQFRLDDVVLSGTNTTLTSSNVNIAKNNFVKNTVVANTIMFAAKADIQILNMNGQVVKTASVSENNSLDVATLPKGIYIVKGMINGKVVSQKIMKK